MVSSSELTAHPRTLAETGLPEELLKDLLLKHLNDGVILDLPQLCARLKLAGNILETILQTLRKGQRLQVHSPAQGASAIRYQLTELGRADAANALLRSGYLGPAPITLAHYSDLIATQSVLGHKLGRKDIQAAFEGVVIEERHLDVLGPALYSGRPILVYGQAGTGKTYICKKMATLLGGDIYLPYAIAVDQEIIQYYDPLVHTPSVLNTHTESLEFSSMSDQRLLLCHRPMAISGGELTMDRLELNYDTAARTSNAPIQMKANNGIYIIDDMGRQRMPPLELFNRWIVPMEERTDYLTLVTGKHFSVPFDCILVFSSNLHPVELADEAFLRRLGYKIHFTPINEQQFASIWQALAMDQNIRMDGQVLTHLLERFRASDRDLLPCHPRDLMGIALNIAAYLDQEGNITDHTLQLAWDTYFIDLKQK